MVAKKKSGLHWYSFVQSWTGILNMRRARVFFYIDNSKATLSKLYDHIQLDQPARRHLLCSHIFFFMYVALSLNFSVPSIAEETKQKKRWSSNILKRVQYYFRLFCDVDARDLCADTPQKNLSNLQKLFLLYICDACISLTQKVSESLHEKW